MKQLIQKWLLLQCKQVSGCVYGVALTGIPGKGSYTQLTSWPENSSQPAVVAAAQTALEEEQCLVRDFDLTLQETAQPCDVVACPLYSGGKLLGVVAVAMSSRPPARQQEVMAQLQTGTFWLEAMIKQQASVAKEQLLTLVELVAASLEHENFQDAATAVVTSLATRLDCERVSIGFGKGPGIQIYAVSNTANFDRRTSMMSGIKDAMYESLDQQETVLYPPLDGALQVVVAHSRLCNEFEVGSVCTVPLVYNGTLVGSLLLERAADKPFDVETASQCEQIGALVGPALESRRRDDIWLPSKLVEPIANFLLKLVGPRCFKLKFATLSSLLLCAVLFLVQGDFRVASNSSLEPSVQRVVVAPQDGYVASAAVRAGDIVQDGDLLAQLENKELLLLRQKWFSQRQQIRKEYRNALAGRNQSESTILKARILQADAQLKLVEKQLLRTRLVAPFSGLVISGDLSQSLGAPVQRGEVLFEVAPLDAYRLIVKVDERDIGFIKTGQQGDLILSGLVTKSISFSITKITPVSVSEDGRNYFRVEGLLDSKSDLLRPGMEGVAKIKIDQRKLIWIWTHRLTDWLRLQMWTWMP